MLKFCYFGGTLDAGEGVKDATRAKVKGAWIRIKKLSPILSACGAPKGKIYRACGQSVLTYGTETLAMKAENRHSLEGGEHMFYKNTHLQMTPKRCVSTSLAYLTTSF